MSKKETRPQSKYEDNLNPKTMTTNHTQKMKMTSQKNEDDLKQKMKTTTPNKRRQSH